MWCVKCTYFIPNVISHQMYCQSVAKFVLALQSPVAMKHSAVKHSAVNQSIKVLTGLYILM
jgi:hypothetical protein